MALRRTLLTPRFFLMLASTLCLVLALTSWHIATSTPSLGIHLVPTDNGAIEMRGGGLENVLLP